MTSAHAAQAAQVSSMSRRPAAGPGHVATAGAGVLDVTTADTSLGKGGHQAEFRIEGTMGTDVKAAHRRKGELHRVPGAVAVIGQLLPSFSSLRGLCVSSWAGNLGPQDHQGHSGLWLFSWPDGWRRGRRS